MAVDAEFEELAYRVKLVAPVVGEKLTDEQLAELSHVYGYHAPTPDQVKRYQVINDAAKLFEWAVLQVCPASADRTFACRQIRDARMTANRSIALHKESESK